MASDDELYDYDYDEEEELDDVEDDGDEGHLEDVDDLPMQEPPVKCWVSNVAIEQGNASLCLSSSISWLV